MFGSFLIGLGESIPVLHIIFDLSVPSDERFLTVHSNDFDYFRPLLSYISSLISLYYSGFNMVVIILVILLLLAFWHHHLYIILVLLPHPTFV